jgi:sarcosine oxidase subunit gamma
MILKGSACVAEQHNSQVSIERIENLSIVSLKVSSKLIASARNSLQLASPASTSNGDPRSLWFGPDRWLLVSESKAAASMVEECDKSLADVLHNAVDSSAGLAVFRLTGTGARDLLAAGCGIDFRDQKFPVGNCCRTRFAQIAAIIAAEGPEQFDIYVDRSYEKYLDDWLRDSQTLSGP